MWWSDQWRFDKKRWFYRSTMLLLVLVSASFCSGEPVGGPIGGPIIGGPIGGPIIGGERLGSTEPFLDSKPWIPSPSQPVHLSRQVTIKYAIELLWPEPTILKCEQSLYSLIQQFKTVCLKWSLPKDLSHVKLTTLQNPTYQICNVHCTIITALFDMCRKE